jgi:cytochrome c1
MKHTKNELDVDFIGGFVPLTKQEEKAISLHLKATKEPEQKQRIKSATKARLATTTPKKILS